MLSVTVYDLRCFVWVCYFAILCAILVFLPHFFVRSFVLCYFLALLCSGIFFFFSFWIWFSIFVRLLSISFCVFAVCALQQCNVVKVKHAFWTIQFFLQFVLCVCVVGFLCGWIFCPCRWRKKYSLHFLFRLVIHIYKIYFNSWFFPLGFSRHAYQSIHTQLMWTNP